jgi:hypothetical protein
VKKIGTFDARLTGDDEIRQAMASAPPEKVGAAGPKSAAALFAGGVRAVRVYFESSANASMKLGASLAKSSCPVPMYGSGNFAISSARPSQ